MVIIIVYMFLMQELVDLLDRKVFVALQEIQVTLDRMDSLGHLDPQVTQALYNVCTVLTQFSVQYIC